MENEIRIGKILQTNNGYFTELQDELSVDEYNHFLLNITEVQNFENRKKLLEIVIYNSNEFLGTVEEAIKYMIENSLSMVGDKQEYYKQHLNFNRLFLNYLSSIRTFIDHSETAIKRKYGKGSNQVNRFESVKSRLFDHYFSYRFLYKLRNYSQHCNLPIEEIEISATKQADDTFKAIGIIEFDTETLLDQYKEWGKVKIDLESTSKLSIFPIIDEMSNAMLELWNAINQIYTDDLFRAVEFLTTKAHHLREGDFKVCIFTDIVNDENGKLKYFKTHQLPFDVIDSIGFKQINV